MTQDISVIYSGAHNRNVSSASGGLDMSTSNWLKNIRYFLLIVVSMVFLSACSEEGGPVRGFVLPEGDLAEGQKVFEAYNCHACHTISGVEFPDIEFQPPFILDIGGEVYRVKNYGELLTSVVNPDHIISKKYIVMLKKAGRDTEVSPMPNFAEEMTVQELMDLVTFLHAQYSRLQPKYYRGYYLTH